MTPKEKAIELFDKYFFPHYVWENDGYQVDEKLTYEVRKRFALIAVDYVIQSIYQIDHKHTAVYDNKSTFYTYKECQELKYWQEVKQEIEAL